ncbi:peptidoglycan editing factor PgeF [Prochlorococcus sp. MIT 1307]|uniref:peptidoglycan editing factor PgeF n=1 Tax=Prochlorococcus sp. MIT 1307 TaxID=3096219 RepID=UPI002A75CCEC|nr:peptidoglycan editing factor PgeF [Prochlorococcus sp. MIT 1307]
MSNKHSSDSSKDWHWIKSKKGSYLQANSLRENGIQHGFFTKEWGNQSPKELTKHLNLDHSIHINKQIHGCNVIEASKACQIPWPSGDGIVSDQKKQSIWIYTSDCIPVLYADPKNGLVAASHAGWRGISKGILLKTIEKLEYFGANRHNLIIALGPAISKTNYQVGYDVVELICQSIYQESFNKPIEAEEKILNMFYLGLIGFDSTPRKFFLDIRLSAANQLYRAGVKPENLSISPFCTFSDQNLFNSWRRDQRKLIQWSFIAN